jgi:hypothetical protein
VEDEHRVGHLHDDAWGHPGSAVTANTAGINVNTLGVILLLIGLVELLYTLLFWGRLSSWGRRRTLARRRTVIEERPVEVVEERPIDDGLPKRPRATSTLLILSRGDAPPPW